MAKRVVDDDFKEMELWEHLAELRTRLMRAVIYVVVGLMVAWAVYPWLFALFTAPLKPIFAEHKEWIIVYRSVLDGFTIRLQVSLVSGLVVALPLITLEAWGFVAPGLTRSERKVCYLLVPLSLVFFFLGVATGYTILGPSLQWFASFVPKDVQVMQDPIVYILFIVKMVVAFGVCFQLPLVLMALCYVGIISSKTLKEQWRFALVGCIVIAAVATPGGDPFSMMLMSAPMAVLYLASIFLCGFVERVKERQEKKETSVDRLEYSGASAD
jgi:sec-independent protein translocase protein TatC